ncbi:MAG: radical SAM protein [Elusimicrobia bacterium]|nr:radical SAM protein [Elusimicrobiota bacterium]
MSSPGDRPRAKPRLSDTYERYALGLARREPRPPPLPANAVPKGGRDARPPASTAPLPAPSRPARPSAPLAARLKRLGVKGWPRRRTFHTRAIPAGCRPCLEGRASTLVVTTLCNRDCFFCFNPRPRADALSVHGRRARSAAEAAALLEGLGIESVGVSGGEPLLFPVRTMKLVRALRRGVEGLRIDVYTNGDLLTPALLRGLKAAGVDSLRLNLAANGYGPGPARLALGWFPDLAVEIPVIPADERKIWRLALGLEEAGVRHLILHELFCSAQNADALGRRGLAAPLPAGRGAGRLTWSGVPASADACLRLVAKAAEAGLRLGLYYCSTGTQQWIAEKALRRPAPGPAGPGRGR